MSILVNGFVLLLLWLVMMWVSNSSAGFVLFCGLVEFFFVDSNLGVNFD